MKNPFRKFIDWWNEGAEQYAKDMEKLRTENPELYQQIIDMNSIHKPNRFL